ncbi:L-aspartate oxidase, partial [Neisseria meningitidis]
YLIRARHTVLAGGGLGQIYAATTTPPECTGDAIAMAIRAGCAVGNLEFIQFHPTGLARSSENGRTFLISEAVRGEGGILTNQAGERFMPHYDRRAELAPRDIVARAIAAEIAKQTPDFVSLDISRQPEAFVRRHFPSIHRHCLSQCGLDITRQAIPVRPVQHYTCGGIQTDPCGRTSLPQLYALGETACTGLHGANRLASNSLLECVVTARLAAQTIADGQAFQAEPFQRPSESLSAEAGIFADDLQNTFSRPVLQTFNQRHLGILRSDTGLRRAIAQLRLWKQNQAEPHTASEYENRNLLECSLAVAQAAYRRRQNIGAHFNSDC